MQEIMEQLKNKVMTMTTRITKAPNRLAREKSLISCSMPKTKWGGISGAKSL
ncbi:MAG: hypothetical protein ACOWWO_07195 [Peptococcaceae bacterium]